MELRPERESGHQERFAKTMRALAEFLALVDDEELLAIRHRTTSEDGFVESVAGNVHDRMVLHVAAMAGLTAEIEGRLRK